MWNKVWVDATLNFEFEGHFQGRERSKLVFSVFALIWTTISRSIQRNHFYVHILGFENRITLQ